MRAGLTIGDFSRITHLSVRTLRRYHEAGLLEPADVDPHSGYRYYSTDQVPTAQVIRRFRELGLPVRDVGRIVHTTDPGDRSALIAEHLERLETELDRTRAAVTSLRRLLRPGAGSIEVQLRAAPAMPVAAVRATVGHAAVLAWYAGASAELDAVLAERGRRATGPRGGLYDNELFTEERGAAVVYVPMAEAPTAGRVHPYVVPAAELATTVHAGGHDDIDVTYGELGRYVANHELAVAGPVREIYHVGPRDTADRADWRTEIGWPVFRTSS
jgi:DNA-binding transcriptional MerR regulator